MTDRSATHLSFDATGGFDRVVPAIARVVALSPTTVEVAFNTAMTCANGYGVNDATNLANYSSQTLTFVSLRASTPSRMVFTVKEMVEGQTYDLTALSALTSIYGDNLPTAPASSFAGHGNLPFVTQVNTLLRQDGTQVRVMFSEGMKSNAALAATASYTIIKQDNSGSLAVSAVALESAASPTYADLTIAPMEDRVPYVLTLGTGFFDQAGNPLDLSKSLLAFVGYHVLIRPKVLSCRALSPNRVEATFSEPLEVTSEALTPLTYSFTGGLTATGVAAVSATVFQIDTSNQLGGGKTYQLIVNPILANPDGVTLDAALNTAFFAGIAAPAVYVVENLAAQTHPDGNRIDLSWSNPSAPQTVKITRRVGSVPYDTTEGVVVYEGVPIETFSDRADLQDNLFYGYVVAASQDGQTYAVDATKSRVVGLSIRAIASADYLYRQFPAFMREADERSTDGMLRPVCEVMGAGFNLIRGEIEAYGAGGDMDRANPTVLPAANRSLMMDPEASFDAATLRRLPLHLIDIYKRKGTATGAQLLVQTLCQWTTHVLEYGGGGLGGLFQTWDGQSPGTAGQGTYDSLQTGPGQLHDSQAALTPGDWAGGNLMDAMGHVIAVKDNLEQDVTWDATSTNRVTTTAAASKGTYVIFVDRTLGLQKQQAILLTDGVNQLATTLFEVAPSGRLVLQEPLSANFDTGSRLYPYPNALSFEVRGEGAAVPGGFVDINKLWVTNEWTGYSLLDSQNQVFEVTGNDLDTLRVAGTPADGPYSLARAFVPAATFADRRPVLRYSLYNGQHSYLYEPTRDLSLMGTSYDPFNTLYAGASSLSEGFSPDDFALFVAPGVALATGKATAVTLNELEDQKATFAPGEMEGMYLNPNRKQGHFVRIYGNTATTLVTHQAIDPVAQEGSSYFILRERDVLRYKRLMDILPKFAPRFTNPRLFFE